MFASARQFAQIAVTLATRGRFEVGLEERGVPIADLTVEP